MDHRILTSIDLANEYFKAGNVSGAVQLPAGPTPLKRAVCFKNTRSFTVKDQKFEN